MTCYKKQLSFYVLDSPEQEELHQALKQLEEDMGIKSLAGMLYALLSELIENAVRANLKRIYFHHKQIELTEDEGYNEILEEFRSSYDEIYRSEAHRESLREQSLSISVTIDLTEERLTIYVVNNSRLLEQEEARIREKLSRAMQADNLLEYAGEEQDTTEGMGLGFAIVVLLIKHLGFKPEYFRIYSADNKTIARLELPLSNEASLDRGTA